MRNIGNARSLLSGPNSMMNKGCFFFFAKLIKFCLGMKDAYFDVTAAAASLQQFGDKYSPGKVSG